MLTVKFDIGDKVIVKGRKEWNNYGWSHWKCYRGKIGIVVDSDDMSITVLFSDNSSRSFLPGSLELYIPGKQLTFSFIKDDEELLDEKDNNE